MTCVQICVGWRLMMLTSLRPVGECEEGWWDADGADDAGICDREQQTMTIITPMAAAPVASRGPAADWLTRDDVTTSGLQRGRRERGRLLPNRDLRRTQPWAAQSVP